MTNLAILERRVNCKYRYAPNEHMVASQRNATLMKEDSCLILYMAVIRTLTNHDENEHWSELSRRRQLGDGRQRSVVARLTLFICSCKERTGVRIVIQSES
jgi:hypothetical protein